MALLRVSRYTHVLDDLVLPERADTGRQTSLPATVAAPIYGTEGDDRISVEKPVGGPNSTSGNDVIYGLGGDDKIHPGKGRDWVDGGAGNDTLITLGGYDTLYGGAGDDRFSGGPQGSYSPSNTVELYGGEGNDVMDIQAIGSRIHSLLDGGAGDDVIRYTSELGWNDGSTLMGGEGNDTIRYETGEMTVDAGTGDDMVELLNYEGSNSVAGGVLTLGDGQDTVVAPHHTGATIVVSVLDFRAGAGGDKFQLVSDWGNNAYETNPFLTGEMRFVQEDGSVLLLHKDYWSLRFVGLDPRTLTADNLVDGYDPNGDFVVRDLTGTSGNDTLLGADGNDTLRGGSGNDVLDGLLGGDDQLYGGGGQDLLAGFSGNDILRGGRGNDALWGGIGDDTLLGGAGNDQQFVKVKMHGVLVKLEGLYGGHGADVLLGGDGDDSLTGATGDDTLIGGAGNDTLTGGYGTEERLAKEDTDVFVFSGQASDGVDTVNNFQTVYARDVIDLSLMFGDAGAQVLDGRPGDGDNFDPLTGPVETSGQNVLSIGALFGHAPSVDDLAELLEGSTFETGQQQAILVFDRAQGAHGDMLLFTGVDVSGDSAIDSGELRHFATVDLAPAWNENAFNSLEAQSIVTSGRNAEDLLAQWSDDTAVHQATRSFHSGITTGSIDYANF